MIVGFKEGAQIQYKGRVFKEGVRIQHEGKTYVVISYVVDGDIIHAKCEEEYPNKTDSSPVCLDIKTVRRMWGKSAY